MSVDVTDPLAPLDDGFDDDDDQDLEALLPYVVNLTGGAFSDDGIMQTTPAHVDAIFDEHLPRFLAGRPGRVPVIFWAHGGIVSERAGLRIAADHVPWWVRNGAYPIHFVWETGLTDTFRSIASIVGLEPVGGRGAPWQSVKRNARTASRPGGGARYVADRLAQFCAEHPGRISVHAAGHSAGAIFHSQFVPTAGALGVPAFGSLQLLAPALRVDDFEATLLPMVGAGIDRFVLYTMTADAELADSCFGMYKKSLLYLVSEMFEDPADTPLIGMERSIRDSRELLAAFGLDPVQQRAAEVIWSPSGPDVPPGRRSSSTSHGGFDNDIDTMNSVAGRVLGRSDFASFPSSRASAGRVLHTRPPVDHWTP
ncbi:MAG TPA: hypothetical protein VIU11_01385 [Nakamurella sp.]